MFMAEIIVSVLGNIGSGKSEFIQSMKEKGVGSQLIEMLAMQGDLNVYEESEKVKEIAADIFYPALQKKDIHTCYAAEIEMLYARVDQMIEVSKNDGLAIIERTPYENRYVFFENLFRSGIMREPFYENYNSTFKHLMNLIPIPDVLVYLRTTPDITYERMMKRGRPSEKGLALEYLKGTHELYERLVDKILPEYIPTYGVKLIRINADHQFDEKELRRFHDQIEERIVQTLRRQGWGSTKQMTLTNGPAKL